MRTPKTQKRAKPQIERRIPSTLAHNGVHSRKLMRKTARYSKRSVQEIEATHNGELQPGAIRRPQTPLTVEETGKALDKEEKVLLQQKGGHTQGQ
jgi:hypothetical protein